MNIENMNTEMDIRMINLNYMQVVETEFERKCKRIHLSFVGDQLGSARVELKLEHARMYFYGVTLEKAEAMRDAYVAACFKQGLDVINLCYTGLDDSLSD